MALTKGPNSYVFGRIFLSPVVLSTGLILALAGGAYLSWAYAFALGSEPSASRDTAAQPFSGKTLINSGAQSGNVSLANGQRVKEPSEVGLLEQPPGSIFSIVADSRTEVRLTSLRVNAFQILGALQASREQPVGVDLLAAKNVAEVLLIDGGEGQQVGGDAYQMLFKNAEGEINLLLELTSMGVDENGYEVLAFESMLAFADGVDGNFLSFGKRETAPSNQFPYANYPPVSYESAVASAGGELNQQQRSDAAVNLSPLKDSEGRTLWQRSLAYEVSVVDSEGQTGRRWVDAFYGVEFSQQDLDIAQANTKRREALVSGLDTDFKAGLLASNHLQTFIDEKVPLSAKELEWQRAQEQHQENYSGSVANL